MVKILKDYKIAVVDEYFNNLVPTTEISPRDIRSGERIVQSTIDELAEEGERKFGPRRLSEALFFAINCFPEGYTLEGEIPANSGEELLPPAKRIVYDLAVSLHALADMNARKRWTH